jgi:DNA segregation ATPase FtsK/SpoIIIE, S-DNA-T family
MNRSIAIKKICQMGGFLLLIVTVFLALSLSSYSVDDPTWNYYVGDDSTVVRNLGGIVGAAVADWALQGLGSTVFLLVGVGSLGAWRLMCGSVTGVFTVVWRGGILLAAISTGSYMLCSQDPIFGSAIQNGGVVGRWLAVTLIRYLNQTGTYFILISAVILVLFVGVDNRPLYELWWQWVRGVGLYLQNALQPMRRGWLRLIHTMGSVVVYVCGWRDAVMTLCRKLQPQRDLPLRSVWEENPHLFIMTREDAAVLEEGDGGPVEDEILQEDDALHAIPIPAGDTTPPVSTPLAPVRRLPRRRLTAGMLPPLDLLDKAEPTHRDQSPEELKAQAQFLEQKLRDFGVEGEVVQVLPGPVITMYEFAPAPGIKVSKITNLQDDLALVMRALSVRVVAPIPGKAVVGIEIPNKRRETVRLRELLDSEEFQTSLSKLTLVLGKDILGKPVVTDLALIPHLLIAGATGSGKSVGLNSMICSLLFRATPADVKVIMIDPKMLELSIYDGIPHLLIPVVTNPKKAAVALRRVVEEMERRYQLLATKGVRSIAQYNQAIEEHRLAGKASPAEEEATTGIFACPVEKLPYLVVVIDELSDLMMISSRDVEDSLTRIAQMARAAGIHLIVATQRPSVDVLTGVIKANFPARMSFQVSSKTDSRTILDANGAEKLLGRGDMLFLAPGTSKPQRIHGAYVSEAEINRLVAAWKELEQPHYDDNFLVSSGDQEEPEEEEYDEKYDEAVALVARTGQASISMLQRRLRVGYNRAARMIEIMEREGVVGPADGVKPREVLVRKDFDEG